MSAKRRAMVCLKENCDVVVDPKARGGWCTRHALEQRRKAKGVPERERRARAARTPEPNAAPAPVLRASPMAKCATDDCPTMLNIALVDDYCFWCLGKRKERRHPTSRPHG